MKLDKPSSTGTGLTATLISVRAVEAKAQLPGEVTGPALAVTIEVRNTGSRTADLGSVVVTVFGSDTAPGAEMTAAPAEPLAGRLAAEEEGARGLCVPGAEGQAAPGHGDGLDR